MHICQARGGVTQDGGTSREREGQELSGKVQSFSEASTTWQCGALPRLVR
jgi:hypothetical protein